MKSPKNIYYRLQLFIVQDLQQAHYPIWLILLLKEFIKLNVIQYKHKDKKCETCGIKYKDYDYFLKYTSFKDNLIEQKCLYCNKNYQKKKKMFDENLNAFLIQIF